MSNAMNTVSGIPVAVQQPSVIDRVNVITEFALDLHNITDCIYGKLYDDAPPSGGNISPHDIVATDSLSNKIDMLYKILSFLEEKLSSINRKL